MRNLKKSVNSDFPFAVVFFWPHFMRLFVTEFIKFKIPFFPFHSHKFTDKIYDSALLFYCKTNQMRHSLGCLPKNHEQFRQTILPIRNFRFTLFLSLSKRYTRQRKWETLESKNSNTHKMFTTKKKKKHRDSFIASRCVNVKRFKGTKKNSRH